MNPLDKILQIKSAGMLRPDSADALSSGNKGEIEKIAAALERLAGVQTAIPAAGIQRTVVERMREKVAMRTASPAPALALEQNQGVPAESSAAAPAVPTEDVGLYSIVDEVLGGTRSSSSAETGSTTKVAQLREFAALLGASDAKK